MTDAPRLTSFDVSLLDDDICAEYASDSTRVSPPARMKAAAAAVFESLSSEQVDDRSTSFDLVRGVLVG
jgi:hypothetical protein